MGHIFWRKDKQYNYYGAAIGSEPTESVSENSVVFANPRHDYPQEIRYRREGHQPYVTISLSGDDRPNSSDKIACE